ncbi:YciI-like protein [Sphingomonas sp.]|uniref:YciI-like protein n=1 Tax=Sphingomonas sp. TaxID=28214 RepID=UPI003B3B2D34
MKHYILFLEFSDSYEARRPEFRDEHLTKAWAAVDRGELVLAGALTDPVDTGVILFKGDSREVAEKFAKDDPYINNGLVRSWNIREWTTVVGHDASSILRPS